MRLKESNRILWESAIEGYVRDILPNAKIEKWHLVDNGIQVNLRTEGKFLIRRDNFLSYYRRLIQRNKDIFKKIAEG